MDLRDILQMNASSLPTPPVHQALTAHVSGLYGRPSPVVRPGITVVASSASIAQPQQSSQSCQPIQANLPSPAPTVVSGAEGYPRRPSASLIRSDDQENRASLGQFHHATSETWNRSPSRRTSTWEPASSITSALEVPTELGRDVRTPPKRSHEGEARASKRQKKSKGVNQKWDPEEDARVIELRGAGMKWVDISKAMPGRTDIACRLHYQNYLEKRGQWDEESKTKLARVYERMKADLWQPLARELGVPWRSAEAMHWMLGEREMARRANTSPFQFHGSEHGMSPKAEGEGINCLPESRDFTTVHNENSTLRDQRTHPAAMYHGHFDTTTHSVTHTAPPSIAGPIDISHQAADRQTHFSDSILRATDSRQLERRGSEPILAQITLPPLNPESSIYHTGMSHRTSFSDRQERIQHDTIIRRTSCQDPQYTVLSPPSSYQSESPYRQLPSLLEVNMNVAHQTRGVLEDRNTSNAHDEGIDDHSPMMISRAIRSKSSEGLATDGLPRSMQPISHSTRPINRPVSAYGVRPATLHVQSSDVPSRPSSLLNRRLSRASR